MANVVINNCFESMNKCRVEKRNCKGTSNTGTCVWGRYKHDSICKHSLAVAAHNSILCAHLDFIGKKWKKGRTRTALAEHDVRKETAGEKGSKNKYAYRPARGQAPSSTNPAVEEDQVSQTPLHSESCHNGNSVVMMFLTEDARRCKSCQLDFYHRKKVIPFA